VELGSDVANILTFDQRYPGVEQNPLEENFRSSQGIVETARAFIRGDVAEETEAPRLVETHLHAPYAYPALRQALEEAASRVIRKYLRDHRALFRNLEFSEKQIEISLSDGVTVNGRIDPGSARKCTAAGPHRPQVPDQRLPWHVHGRTHRLRGPSRVSVMNSGNARTSVLSAWMGERARRVRRRCPSNPGRACEGQPGGMDSETGTAKYAKYAKTATTGRRRFRSRAPFSPTDTQARAGCRGGIPFSWGRCRRPKACNHCSRGHRPRNPIAQRHRRPERAIQDRECACRERRWSRPYRAGKSGGGTSSVGGAHGYDGARPSGGTEPAGKADPPGCRVRFRPRWAWLSFSRASRVSRSD